MKDNRTRRRFKVWPYLLLLLLLIGLAGVATALWSDPDRVGHFRTEAGRRAYLASYDAALSRLPRASRRLDLQTDFGSVRVYEFSSEDTQGSVPIVLLPGHIAGAPMWAANLAGLAKRHTVYALDALGDAGLSVQTRKIADAADQAAWLEQALAQLGVPKVHLVGHSFGGWSAANYALRYPEQVASLALLEPVFVFQGLRWQVYLTSLPASIPFLPQRWRDAMLSDFGGVEEIDPNDPMAAMISQGTEHYASKLPLPERPSRAQLQSLKLPVYLALAGKSYMHDAAAAAAVARESVGTLRLHLWPNGTHSLPMEVPEQLEQQLLEFFASAQRG